MILRHQAESLLEKKLSKTASHLSETETMKFMHELEVHQIELVLQNEELMLEKISTQAAIDLFDYAPSGYFALSRNGEIIRLNIGGSHLLGKERSRLLNSLFGFFVAENSKPVFNLFLERVFTGKVKETSEVAITAEGNAPKFVHLAGIVSENSGQCLIAATDITERKQMEMEVQDAREYAESIVETMREPLVVLSADLTILTVNRSFYETFAVTPAETIGKFIYDLGNGQWNIPRLRVLLEEILPHDTMLNGYEVEHDFLHIGRKVLLLNAREIFRKKIGSHIILLSIEDITERKRSERLQAQESERISVTLRSIGDGVITTDINGTIVMLNRSAEKMTEWKTADAAGRPLSDVFVIINDLTRETCKNPVEDVLTSRGIIELANNTCLISKNGLETLIADSAAPIYDIQSRIIGVVLVFRDITKEKKISDSMQQMQKLESLGVLAGGIAHDFNNMFAGIFGYLDLAKESAALHKTDKIVNYLDKAFGVFDRAKGLTHQLLTFSKGGAPVRKTILMAPLIQHSAIFALSGSNASCRFDLADNLWLCNCDENQIGQAIDNIVINAKQAMPMGGKIVITAINVREVLGHAGRFVRISIKDEGMGMTQEVLSKIFDPFFTAKPTGHGLGLATVFSIIQRHDGWVDVESTPGIGTMFHMFIPASEKEEIQGTAYQAAHHEGTGSILVMDDEEFLRDIVGSMLESMGYTVACAKDGQEALALFIDAARLGQPFVASILDLTIPGGIGGKEIAAAMKKINPNSTIIASSGYSEDPVISNPTQYGFTDRIIKPYRKEELAELMERIMQR